MIGPEAIGDRTKMQPKIVFRKNGQVLCDSVLIGHHRGALGVKMQMIEFVPWSDVDGYVYRLKSNARELRKQLQADATLIESNRK